MSNESKSSEDIGAAAWLIYEIWIIKAPLADKLLAVL
jgi:hypothetical protein